MEAGWIVTMVDAIFLVIAISIAIPLIMHRLIHGSSEQQMIRAIEKADCHPDHVKFLRAFLDDLKDRNICSEERIEYYEAEMWRRKENAKKYWKVDL
jgi:hypothetical protein